MFRNKNESKKYSYTINYDESKLCNIKIIFSFCKKLLQKSMSRKLDSRDPKSLEQLPTDAEGV